MSKTLSLCLYIQGAEQSEGTLRYCRFLRSVSQNYSKIKQVLMNHKSSLILVQQSTSNWINSCNTHATLSRHTWGEIINRRHHLPKLLQHIYFVFELKWLIVIYLKTSYKFNFRANSNSLVISDISNSWSHVKQYTVPLNAP